MELKAAVLYICKVIETRGDPVDLPSISRLLDSSEFTMLELERQAIGLIDEGYLTNTDTGAFLLTDRGREKALVSGNDYQKMQYNRFMLKLWHSEAYLDFCRDLYGYRWCLLNSLYKEQYHHLFNKLDVHKGDTILDIGCGSGAVLHHLVNTYACRGIGVDLARDVISLAGARYPDVTFYEAEIESIGDSSIEADILISLDSLYCCRDLGAVISGLAGACRKQMYMFFSQTVDSEHGDRDILHADQTDLARALQSNDLSYRATDFGSDEWSLWRREKEILANHRAAFEKEGNLAVWEGRVADTDNMLRLFRDNRAARFLYATVR